MMLPAIYIEFGELAHRLGVRNIKELPGCWEYQIDEQWWMAVRLMAMHPTSRPSERA